MIHHYYKQTLKTLEEAFPGHAAYVVLGLDQLILSQQSQATKGLTITNEINIVTII